MHRLSEVGIIVAMYPSGQKHFFHLTTVYETHIIIIPPITIIIPSNFLHRLVAGVRASVCAVCACGQNPQLRPKPSQAKLTLAYSQTRGFYSADLAQESIEKNGNKHESITT